MSHKIYHVHLSYLEVVHPDGHVDTVPWTELTSTGHCLIPSEAVRLACPRLPKRFPSIGLSDRLAIRAWRRAIRDGKLRACFECHSEWGRTGLTMIFAVALPILIAVRLLSLPPANV